MYIEIHKFFYMKEITVLSQIFKLIPPKIFSYKILFSVKLKLIDSSLIILLIIIAFLTILLIMILSSTFLIFSFFSSVF